MSAPHGMLPPDASAIAIDKKETSPETSLRQLNNTMGALVQAETSVRELTRRLIGLPPSGEGDAEEEADVERPFVHELVISTRKVQVKAELLVKNLEYLQNELGV